MAVALEAVDLVVIALFLFLLAFLHATKWTVQPIVGTLHGALGWIPGAGGLVDRVDRAVIGALNDAIGATEESISTLWAGFVWSLNEMIDGLSWAWDATADALEHAFTTTIPNALTDVYNDARHAGTVAGNAVAGAEASIADAVKRAEHFATVEATHAFDRASRYVDAQLSKYAGAIGGIISDFDLRLRGVEHDVAHALDVAENAVSGAAGSTTTTITKIVEGAGSEALAELVAAEHAVAGELPRLPGIALDDIEALLRSNEFGTLAGLLAAIPLINALVHALAAESGLSTAECRQKVKGICGTDPARWEHLLAALAFTFAWPGLDDFAEAIVEVADEVAGVITDFVGVAG